jgi:polysaccharide export outer membrane protein
MNLRMRIVVALVAVPLFCGAQTPAPASSNSESQTARVPASPNNGAPPATRTTPQPETVPPFARSSDAVPAPPPTRKAGAPNNGAVSSDKSSEKPGTSLYVIGPLDVLYVKVWNNANLTGMVDVQDDGMISMALIGQVKADGSTVEQLKNTLVSKLGEFIQNPEVTVQVTKNNSKKFYIMGEGATRQGAFPLNGKMTISEALANAGGFRDFANLKKIYLLRKSENYKEKHLFNYKDVIAGKHLEQDIGVENGDRIVVPQ